MKFSFHLYSKNIAYTSICNSSYVCICNFSNDYNNYHFIQIKKDKITYY